MKLLLLVLILLFAVVTAPLFPQQSQLPLTKSQVMDLVKFGMSTPDLSEKIRTLGIDFDPTDAYLQTLRNAGAEDGVIQTLLNARPKPLTREQLGKLLTGGVPSERAAALVKQHGIDFQADEEYCRTLRLAGADDSLIAALREANAAATAHLMIATLPNAAVYLDGELRGRANPLGELALETKPGVHAVKVTLAGKKDLEQSITLAGGPATRIEARLVDAPGSLRVRTVAGASVMLDNSARGSADANGELVLGEVAPGPHELRVTAQGKKDYRQTVTVLAGQESRMEARLESAGPAPGTARQNPKDGLKYVWIPPGTFQMGCSPGDNECDPDEKPVHSVTITKGFWMGQAEVTVEAFSRFTKQTGAKMPKSPRFNLGWSNHAMPIVNVLWEEAHAYCEWAGGRLPTEAEWEYAARGGSPAERYGPLDDIAWYADNSGDQRLDSARLWREDQKNYWRKLTDNNNRTRVGAQKRANGFGLFDVLGNVWEWVGDWYQANYYQTSPATDPQGPASGESRVLRGGSWSHGPKDLRVSYHFGGGPAHRSDFNGFRCGGEVFAP